MSSEMIKNLFVYENSAYLRQIEVAPGHHYLGLDERGQLRLGERPEDLRDPLARLELLKDGSASIRKRRAEIELFVNERPVREAPLMKGDEILLSRFILTWDERKNLKGYVFAHQEQTPFLIVEDAGSREVRVSAVLPSPEASELTQVDTRGGYIGERVARQMSSLLLVSREINSINDPDALLDRAVDYLFSVLMIDRAAVLLLVPGQAEPEIPRVAYRRGRPPESIRLPGSITSQCLQRRAGLLVTNAQEDPRYRSKPSVIQSAIHGAMVAPLLHEAELLGALYVDTSNPAVEFSLDDLKFLSIFANLLTVAVKNARKVAYLERKTAALQEAQTDGEFLVGRGKVGQDVERLLKRVALSNVTVLLTGESGVGKEVAARRLHAMSTRSKEPFLAINCAAVPDTLIEAELFGHDKGAFTGAEQAKPGRFELADGGTLLLDEIGEIPLGFQAKLLRVLEGHGFERVGGTRTLKPSIRLVAATNRDLRAAVRNGTFREDLFYRLSVFPIHLPSLRERQDDIMDLARFFVNRFAMEMRVPPLRFTPDGEALMQAYPWPGNVRELRNVIERLMILCDGAEVDEETLRESLQVGPGPVAEAVADLATTSSQGGHGGGLPGGGSLWDREAEAIRAALAASNGNKSKAARLLGISRHHLTYRLKKYGIPG